MSRPGSTIPTGNSRIRVKSASGQVGLSQLGRVESALYTVRLPVPGHFYSCVVSKYLLRENEISVLLL